MLLQTVRPNIVQSIRALSRRRSDACRRRRRTSTSCTPTWRRRSQSKRCWTRSRSRSCSPTTLARTWTRCTTALDRPRAQGRHAAWSRESVLEQLPDNPRFDREAREQLLDVFRDAADFWAESRDRIPLLLFVRRAARCRRHRTGSADTTAHVAADKPAAKSVSKSGANPELRRLQHAADEQRVRHRDVDERGVIINRPDVSMCRRHPPGLTPSSVA